MESFKDAWNLVSEYCKGQITKVAYELWITCIEPVSFEDGVANLRVSSSFQKDIIEKKYLSILARAFEETLGFEVKINIIADEGHKTAAPSQSTTETQEPTLPSFTSEQVEQTSRGGDYEYTFNTFIVGPSNKFAHAACLAVASNPSGTYNPLFIHGGSGLGKTHLLYAITNEISHSRPGTNIIYVKGEEFTNELRRLLLNPLRSSTQNTVKQTSSWSTTFSLSAEKRARRKSSSIPSIPSTTLASRLS